MTGFAAGAGKVLPAMVSTYTTDLPVETLPSIVPAKAADATTRTNKSVSSKRRVIRVPFDEVEIHEACVSTRTQSPTPMYWYGTSLLPSAGPWSGLLQKRPIAPRWIGTS